MADEGDVRVASESSTGKWILLALAAIYVAGSFYFIIDLRGRLSLFAGLEHQKALAIRGHVVVRKGSWSRHVGAFEEHLWPAGRE